MTQSLGVGRVLGQIYAYLYFSQQPRTLANMQEALGISKGSASIGVRQLEQWGAVRKVWVRADRRDYYEANDWFGRIVKSAVIDTAGKKISAYSAVLDEIQKKLEREEGVKDEEQEFIRKRVTQLRVFQEKARNLWSHPLVQLFLK